MAKNSFALTRTGVVRRAVVYLSLRHAVLGEQARLAGNYKCSYFERPPLAGRALAWRLPDRGKRGPQALLTIRA